MSLTEAPPFPPCSTCGVPLDGDQQYCVNCGHRIGPVRTDLLAALPGASRPVEETVVAPVAADRAPGPLLWSPLGGAALACLASLGLLLGGLLWAGDERDIVVNVPRQEAPRVTVSVPAGAAAAVPAEFVSDWPGDDGWTVQLETLPKESTQPPAVDAAKAAATTKGAEDVGALDSDEHPSLDEGVYVVYAGVFRSRKAATRELRGLRKDFPEAKVVKVSGGSDGGKKVDKDADKQSAGELKDLQSAAGDDFVKKSKKLKDKVATQGRTPKTDDKKPGGSSDGTVLE